MEQATNLVIIYHIKIYKKSELFLLIIYLATLFYTQCQLRLMACSNIKSVMCLIQHYVYNVNQYKP